MPQFDTWQEALSLTMDGLLIGAGWHPVEKKDDLYFRWLGPDNRATVHVSPRRDTENRLNITICSAASEAVLQGLTLEADGIPLRTSLSVRRSPAYLTAVLPKDASMLPGQHTILSFHVPETIPESEALSGSANNRRIGIALQAVHIFPLARPLFIVEKFTDPHPFDGLDYMHKHPGVRDAVVHGVSASAYEYFIKHREDNNGYISDIHELFDERPGDLFDILAESARIQSQAVERNLLEEIALLRGIVQRQGDAIRALKVELAKAQAVAIKDKA